MSYPLRVADRFKTQSAEQLVTMAGAVITGLTNNPAFPTPTVDLKAVQGAAEDLKAALSAQAHGGMAATAEKNNKEEILITLLRKLKHYVEDNCNNACCPALQRIPGRGNQSHSFAPCESRDPRHRFRQQHRVGAESHPYCAREVLRSAVGSGGRRRRSGGLANRRPVHQLEVDDHRGPRPGDHLYFPGARSRRIHRL